MKPKGDLSADKLRKKLTQLWGQARMRKEMEVAKMLVTVRWIEVLFWLIAFIFVVSGSFFLSDHRDSASLKWCTITSFLATPLVLIWRYQRKHIADIQAAAEKQLNLEECIRAWLAVYDKPGVFLGEIPADPSLVIQKTIEFMEMRIARIEAGIPKGMVEKRATMAKLFLAYRVNAPFDLSAPPPREVLARIKEKAGP